jgi:hypothetical protein
VSTYKRLAFQSLSVALQTANARMLRSGKALVSPLSLHLNYKEQRASLEMILETPYTCLLQYKKALY